MGLWEFLVAVVAIEAIVKLVKIKVAQRERWQAGATHDAELIQRLDKLERRMANIETIVLETEKKREFERAL